LGLRSALATPDSKGRYVRRLFDRIANRYDLITVLLSFGLDRRWKRRLVDLADVVPDEPVLDLACGTGDLTFEAAGRRARVVGLDVTPRMIARARARVAPPLAVRFLVGDMSALPFPSASFNLVTAGYGIRNATAIEPVIDEIHRVLKPGGRLLSLDFDRPVHPIVRALYLTYLTIVGSALGLALHGDPDTYRYIPETIRRYPGARPIARLMQDAGFDRVDIVPVLGGLLAIHVARKPVFPPPRVPVERRRP
jgi:demethylmenaquinone methyltransferase/2-methoxy-6-polyprenyl-1,4-benzoquinol methylase